MNVLIAASIFDSPWLLALFILVGVLSNWLMKRRQEKEDADQPSGRPPPRPGQTEEEPDFEAALRRLLGEKVPPRQPPVVPSPPPLPRSADPSWSEAEVFEPAWAEEGPEAQPAQPAAFVPPPPPVQISAPKPPPVPAVAATVMSRGADRSPSEAQRRAARRFTQRLQPGGKAGAATSGAQRRLPVGQRAEFWRDPGNAREAFVASLVFGPPKGLEP
jgi:hypothetical protein